MTRLVPFIVALVAMLACAGDALAEPGASYPRCVEDDPCWTWPTMGNHKRGVMLRSGKVRIVGPCGFRRLSEAHRLRFSAAYPRLRGDGWARRHGCIGSVLNW